MVTEISVPTERTVQLKDVTRAVSEVVRNSGVQSGLCVVFCPHTTAGLAINENADPDVASDLERAFQAVVPRIPFRHAEGNSPAHLLSCLTRHSLQLIIAGGSLRLGRWQGIYFCEFDGPRRRSLWIKILEG
ncbi:MAG: secondary thiamine-phosphate synthase enzyme YjbQ [Acidobacteriota bacterium]